MNYAVIMAGGSGTRLWPMSRKSKPKQLHNLVSDKSLIQETYSRVKKTLKPENIYISTNAKYIDEIKKQLPDLPEENYIVEPAVRNTAPALAYIAFNILRKDENAIIATLASDHIVNNIDVFSRTITNAFEAVKKYPDHLVAVGINPTKPETGLGYIKMGKPIGEIDSSQLYEVKAFVEKPDLKTAEKYIQSWEYLWNGAYYFFGAKQLLGWIKKYRPKAYETLEKIDELQSADKNNSSQGKIKELFETLEDEQIEYAVIAQKDFDKTLVIPADLGWSDIGNWGTLHDVLSEKYESSMISRGYHIDVDSEGCLVYGGEKMIATLGLEDIIVIDTPDVTLIADKHKAQDVKKLLDKLKSEGKHLYL